MKSIQENPWKTLASEVVHKNRWYSVRKDTVIMPNGKQGEYNVIDHDDAVFVVALDKDNQIYLIGLYRYPTNMYSLEIPAGGSDGEDPLIAAKRELQEETGLAAKEWKLLGKLQSANGFLNEFAHIFLAKDLHATGEDEQEVEGITTLKRVPFEKALSMIQSGEITDCQSVAAISLAAIHLGILTSK
ncbi:MAG TPA: NUDIX hydrolase [Candidatus Saccharimonadales bacterium]|nr:NUDIX hydrolase [Candidatus Saccharimonadales bacterium]